jgi:hypothetical protein
VICQIEARFRTLDLRVRLSEFYFVGDWIDYEEELAFVDDVTVLKMDLRQCAPHLSAKVHLLES